MKVREIISWFDDRAPFAYQEPYDNSGLQTGSPDLEIKAALLCIDVTEEVVDECINLGANLIISHHPVIFSGLKRITGSNFTERIIIKAIKNDIAILSVHTNIDSAFDGVSSAMCNKLGLNDLRILEPAENLLVKLAFFVPVDHAVKVRQKIFEAGAGVIGNYDMCSFNIEGTGTFRGSESTNPFAGEKGKLSYEKEIRVETVMPAVIQDRVIKAMLEVHPYEEVAYDLYPLKNEYARSGMGMTGILEIPETETDFLTRVKDTFMCPVIRHTKFLNRPVKKIAVCGGSGSSLLSKAIKSGADVFISGDFKYHNFFDAEDKILIVDTGHFESEQFTKEIFYDFLAKKLPTFAVYLSEVKTNPINYF